MTQISVQKFSSECGKINVFVENETPLGEFHDYLMSLKGYAVEKMVAAHKEQKDLAESQKQESEKEEACTSECK